MRKPLMSAAAAIALDRRRAGGLRGHGRGREVDRRGIPAVGRSAATSRRPRCSGSSTPPRPSPAWRSTCCRRRIPTHTYESTVLTKAFEEITGIKVNHQILGEGEVVQAVQTQMQTNRNLYDAYVNDSDLIGTHSPHAAGLQPDRADGRRVGRRDLADARPRRLHGRSSFTTGPDGNLYQLPDQQFVNLYWFRKDWFDNPDFQAALQGEVRLRPRRAGQLVGLRGHRRVLHQRREGDRRRPGLRPHGLRQARARPRLAHDRRLALDGRRRHRRASRTASRSTSGASAWRRAPATRSAPRLSRGGEANGPAAVYAIAKWDEWLRKYAPPGAASYDFYQSLPALSQGNVAQQIFWYTAFARRHGQAEVRGQQHRRRRGQPALARWRPSPHGPYWKDGQKVGYQDVGSWTILKSTPERPRQGRLALRAVRHLEDRRHQEEPRRADLHPRQHDPRRELHRARAEARRPGRVLPLARPGALVADRHQRARLPEARADLVAADRRRELRLLHAAGGDGRARRRRWTTPWPACSRSTRRPTSTAAAARG